LCVKGYGVCQGLWCVSRVMVCVDGESCPNSKNQLNV